MLLQRQFEPAALSDATHFSNESYKALADAIAARVNVADPIAAPSAKLIENRLRNQSRAKVLKLAAEYGVELEGRRCTHVEVLRVSKIQQVTARYLRQITDGGFGAIVDGKLIVKTKEGEPDLVLKIHRSPGTFCAFCSESLADTWSGIAHIAADHAGRPDVAIAITEGDREKNLAALDLPNNPGAVVAALEIKSPDPNNPSGIQVTDFYDCECETSPVTPRG